MSIFINPEVPDHTHGKFENSLEINGQLVINSVNDSGKSWLRRDSKSTYILTDRDGNGSWDSPWPLKLDHQNNQGFLFDEEVWTESNLPKESGLFTPYFSVKDASASITYSLQRGVYVQQGNFLHITIQINVTENTSPSGNLQIEGLPFPSKGFSVGIWEPVNVSDYNNISLSNTGTIRGLIHYPEGDYIRLYERTSSGLIHLQGNSLLNNSYIRLGATYAV